ncbi:hypothetical protein LRB11_14485 [Ectothiorhodospira haloalkaliphila]|uniref:hypothetical protein n=1 Tax=Ectothiorhodospira haloalkaliphila TaxID=421628 RepID=UPI001EE908D2|nr:hypothetical protein [Ectothiorhodospira haloalkaliphila]MCG5526121.1 hypothetical protein [Ectothiorhodospira haloalkaliphila]
MNTPYLLRRPGLTRLMLGVLCVPLLAAPALAQAASAQPTITEQQFLDYLRQLAMELPPPPPQASQFGVISGFGMPHGTAFVAGVLTDRRERRSDRDYDGSAGVGVGFGNARDAVGVDVTLGIISTTPSEFAEDGNLNVKVHRQLPGLMSGGVSSVAVGVGNLVRWGDAREVDQNRYASASTLLPLSTPGGRSVPVMLTAGHGTAISDLGREADSFFGAGVGLTSRFSATASWAGDEWITGVSWLERDLNMQVTLAMGDATDRLGDGRRYILAVAFTLDDVFSRWGR